MIDRLMQIIHGEKGPDVVFSPGSRTLSNTVFESVAAFSNRFGGFILLGVQNDRRVTGIYPSQRTIYGLKRIFADVLGDPAKFCPTLNLRLEDAVIDEETILWCYVPPSPQLVLYRGRRYVRNVTDNIDTTNDTEMGSVVPSRWPQKYYNQRRSNTTQTHVQCCRKKAVETTIDELSDNMSDNRDDSVQHAAILAYLYQNGEINTKKAAKIIGRSPVTARRILAELVAEGKVIPNGANRNRSYRPRSE